ncbi:MAG: LptF/LptG family permease [Deltaproteobacteria bacterium]|nr:LptF/LptG family permease [Deltaproteobacteria bacterium]
MITRYLLRLLARRTLSTLFLLSIIYSLFDLSDTGRRLAPSLGWTTVLHAAVFHLPTIAVQLMPVATLLGGVLVLASLHQRSELEALASLGVTPRRLGRSLLLLGLSATLGSLFVGEVIAPPLEQRADHLYGGRRASALTGQRSHEVTWLRRGPWFLRQGPKDTLLGIEVSNDFHITRRLEGRRQDATIRDVVEYRKEGSRTRHLRHSQTPFPALNLLNTIDRMSRGRAESHGIRELQQHRRLAAAIGRDASFDNVFLHLRLTFPALNIVSALILWALALGRARGARLYAIATSWIALLWLITAGGFLLAQAGLLSPVAGTWGSLSLISGGAGIMLARAWPRG